MTLRDIAISIGFNVDPASEKQTETKIKGLKGFAMKAFGAIGLVVSVAKVGQFLSDCKDMASSVQEMENKFNVVFEGISDEVDKWAEDFANAVGRNKNTIKTYLADQQNLLVGFGMTREEGSKLSEEMTSLALDIASFANQDEDVAVNAMTKAVMGQSEAAKTLGAVLNDVTRAETMMEMGLSGNYNSLDQLTKMQVNYNTILRQSKDAVGDCVRSIDSYEARQRQLHAAQDEFKEFIGGQLLPVLATFTKWMTKGVKLATKFSKAILLDSEGNRRFAKSFDTVHAIVKKLKPVIDRLNSAVHKGVEKSKSLIKALADKFGGIDNLMRILTVTAGALILVMTWGKVIGAISMIKNLLGGVSKLLGGIQLKTLAIVAVVVILALIIEDFIQFMLGNDSVLGTIFEKMGIDSEKARAKIKESLKVVVDAFGRLWSAIKSINLSSLFSGILNSLKPVIMLIKLLFVSFGAFWNAWGDEIISLVLSVWHSVGGILNGVISVLIGFVNFINSVLAGDWEGAWEAIKQIFFGILMVIISIASAAWEALKLIFTMALTALKTTIESILTGILNLFISIFTAIISAVTQKVSSIKDAVVNGFNSAIEWIKSLPAQAYTWGADMIDGIVRGIWASIGKVTEAVKGVGAKIKSFLHFSVPDEGPLTDYETWMPDFMKGLASGIEGNEDLVLNKVKSLASRISDLVKAGTAVAKTAYNGMVSNNSSSITQNVNINNSYNGGSRNEQKTVSKAMKKSAVDATTYMARNLAYSRG